MEYESLQPKLPQHIALSFSGGGFRAAAFTLGCISYMEKVDIDGRKMTTLINFISSASGGTITNLLYTANQRQGKQFEECFRDMNEKMLKGTAVLDRVFEILNDKKIWKSRPGKSRNIINAFSIAYDELFFNGADFGLYFNGQQGVVPEVCTNATEFKNGMIFRFQNAGEIGNKFLKFKDDAASIDERNAIKLGDILACSSCFTVGFEPFMFPQDFSHEKLSAAALQGCMISDSRYSPATDEQQDAIPLKFGLMDGGIDDNQGIDSFIRAEERLQRANKFGHDLYISCDVSSNYTSGYNFPQENKKSWLTKFSLLQYILLMVLLAGLSAAGIVTTTLVEWCYTMLGITVPVLLVSLIISIKAFSVWRKIKTQHNTYALVLLGHTKYFLTLRLSAFLQLLQSRATSAGYLAAVVFLKKIRRISYDRLFEKITERKLKANGSPLKNGEEESLATKIEVKHWRNFSLQNAIYLLSPKNDAQRIKDLKSEDWYDENLTLTIDGTEHKIVSLMQPSVCLQATAKRATDMDTTLWFDQHHVDQQQPQALMATGQFTSCYNLLRYALRFPSSEPVWNALQVKLATDWKRFNEDNVYWMYEEYNANVTI